MRTTAWCRSACVALAALGCSGRYEVGGADSGETASAGRSSIDRGSLDGSASRGSTDGASTSGGSESGASAKTGGGSGTSTTGGVDTTTQGGPFDEFGPSCVPGGKPASIRGALAEPAVVWDRLTLLIDGDAVEPPSELPEVTSEDWAVELVTQAFAQLPGETLGGRNFIEAWLFPNSPGETAEPLVGPWAKVLAANVPALEQLLTLDFGEEHHGVFSEPRWLTSWRTGPARGVRISNALLQPIPPAPPDVVKTLDPPLGTTYRQALELLVHDAPCQSCHVYIDPLGYAFDNFDELGRFRTSDNGVPLDTSGTYNLRNRRITFNGSRELGQALADSCDGQLGLADAFLRTALRINGHSEDAQQALFDENRARVRQAFIHSERRAYADLVRAFARSSAVLRP